MSHIITVSNQKGGVGKTTTVVNLSAFLAREGYRVLTIDLDAQCNTTDTLLSRLVPDYADEDVGLQPDQTVAAIFADEPNLPIYDTLVPNLKLVPSHPDLSRADEVIAKAKILEELSNTEMRLKQALKPHLNSYDFVIIDTPRDMNIVVKNALVASNWLLVPCSADFYSLQGISQVIKTMKSVKDEHSLDIQLLGILITRSEPTEISKRVYEELTSIFGSNVMRTKIVKNVAAAEAPGFSMDIFEFKPSSAAALHYSLLGGEILSRLNN